VRSKIKNSENIQICTVKISTRFILSQKWCKLVFPYLKSAKCPRYKPFPVLFNQSYLEATSNVHYDKLYHKVESFLNISETYMLHNTAAQLIVMVTKKCILCIMNDKYNTKTAIVIYFQEY